MVQLDLTYFEERLLDEQEQIMGIADLINDAGQLVKTDQNSVGGSSRMNAIQSQGMTQQGGEQQQQRLVRIEQALHRIDDGLYGRCPYCDQSITIARLELEPTAERCSQCVNFPDS